MTSPQITRLTLTGTPGEVEWCVTLLSGAAEINFLSPPGDVDARGEVTRTVQLIRSPGSGTESEQPSGLTTVTLQAVVDFDPAQWSDLTTEERSREIEADTARMLSAAIPGSTECRARVVATRPARAPRS
ncbi:hypothetical protein GCM10009578_038650 [Streptomyces rhizosphaericus]